MRSDCPNSRDASRRDDCLRSCFPAGISNTLVTIDFPSGQLVRVNFIRSDIRSGWEKVRLVVSDALTPRPDSNHLLSSPLTISCCPNRWHLESWLAEDRFLNSFYLLTKTPRNWRLGQNSAAGNQITAAEPDPALCRCQGLSWPSDAIMASQRS